MLPERAEICAMGDDGYRNANIGIVLSRMNRKPDKPREPNFVERLNAVPELKEDYVKPGLLRWTMRNGGTVAVRIKGKTVNAARIEFDGVGERRLYILGEKELKSFTEAEAETLEILQ